MLLSQNGMMNVNINIKRVMSYKLNICGDNEDGTIESGGKYYI